jgi:hypothetical protein
MLFFTDAGIEALRAMMRDGRLADPEKFAHIRRELGIDPGTRTDVEDETVASVAPGVACRQ